MPKKIVIKFKDEKRDEGVEELPQLVSDTPPLNVTAVQERAEELVPAEVPERHPIEEVMKDYDSILSRLQDIKLREQIFQKMFMEQDLSIFTVKRIVSKWNDMRDEVIKDVEPLREKMEAVKSKLEVDFSRVEADLCMSIVELDAIKHKEERKIPVSQKEKADLETRVAVLRQELSEKKKLINELEAKIRELTDLPRKIYALTSYTELADRLYQELKEKHGAKFGPRPDEVLQKNIEMTVQSEGIPMEYAIILIWKRISSS